jgi:hypothetical protein
VPSTCGLQASTIARAAALRHAAIAVPLLTGVVCR